MPTGYTAGVQDGTITEFGAFAMQCARAFGALIEMRDDPMDAPVPQEFKPSDYHVKAKAEAEARLIQLVAMDEGEAHDRAKAEFDAAVVDLNEYRAKAAEQGQRYLKMLNKATAWTAPTKDHDGLRDFMINQLNESIRHDCDTSYRAYPTQLTGKEWLANSIESARKSIGYHTEQLIEEEKRARTRTEWVKSLRLSLPKAGEQVPK